MSEKTLVTIDCDLIIPKEEEKIFENQHIVLEAKIQCSGTLIFRNCTIEPHYGANETQISERICGITIYSDSKLEMEGCEIIHPSERFLDISGDVVIRNTSFRLSHLPYPWDVITAYTYGSVHFIECSFMGEEIETESGRKGSLSDREVVFESCTFKSIPGSIYAKVITKCSFVECGRIGCKQISSSAFDDCIVIEGKKIDSSTFQNCGVIEGEKIDSSTFQNCEVIEAVFSEDSGRGYIKNCNFNQIGGIASAKIDIQNCKFQTLRKAETNKANIGIDRCNLTHCSFDDVELSNNSYLIIYSHGSNIEDCQFTNCCTDREDSELFIKESVLNDRIREQERKERIEAFKQGGLLKGALKLFGVAARSATQAAAGAAVAVAQEAGDVDKFKGDVDKFKKRVETERKKLEREQHKQK